MTKQHGRNSKKGITSQIKIFNTKDDFKPIQSEDSSKIKITVIAHGRNIIWTTR